MLLRAPAKLNLTLKILGKRADGYHDLESLMAPISLYDKLALEPGDSGISLSLSPNSTVRDIPLDAENLAHQAANAFFKAAKIAPNVSITLAKHIPHGAGLGGGSSNAAAVLSGLNTMHGQPLTQTQLAQLALKLGADVPFFLLGQPALAKGVGEILTPIHMPLKLAALVVYPGFGVPTKTVYQNLNLALTSAHENSTPQGSKTVNDLEEAAFKLFPEIKAVKTALYTAEMKDVGMTGSGSAVFGLCHDLYTAKKFAKKVQIKDNWRVFTVEILNKSDIVT